MIIILSPFFLFFLEIEAFDAIMMRGMRSISTRGGLKRYVIIRSYVAACYCRSESVLVYTFGMHCRYSWLLWGHLTINFR